MPKREQVLKDEEIEELVGYLKTRLQDAKSWRDTLAHQAPEFTDKDLKEVMRWLKNWKAGDKEYVAFLILLLVAIFVEAEVERKVEDVLSKKINRFLGSDRIKRALLKSSEHYGEMWAG